MVDRACFAVCRDHVFTSWVWILEKKAVVAVIVGAGVVKGSNWCQIMHRVFFSSDISRVGSGMSECDRSSLFWGSTHGWYNIKTLLLCFEENVGGLQWQMGTRRASPRSPERIWVAIS